MADNAPTIHGVDHATGPDRMGFWGVLTTDDGQRVPLNPDQAAAIWAEVEASRAKRAAEMPDERAALRVLHDAWQRLKELGWREAIYCPKDGSSFDVIEIGSTGIHRGFYSGEWPTGHLMVGEGMDCGPSREAILFRLDPEAEAARRAKMAEAARQFREEMARELEERPDA